ncbi:MAG: DUF3343 domain-containing protein [Candidatus Obscuribacterales bacterium]
MPEINDNSNANSNSNSSVNISKKKRLILTFPTLHQVLAAERALRESGDKNLRCRPTPTPPGLSESICGMAIEIFSGEQKDSAIKFLIDHKLEPSGCHLVD